MNFLLAQKAIASFNNLILSPFDIAEIFKKSGRDVNPKNFSKPQLDMENAKLYEIGSAVKAVVPLKVRNWTNDTYIEQCVFISVFVGEDGSVLVQGDFGLRD